jgi:RNase H-like domain found in reverse transcriptase
MPNSFMPATAQILQPLTDALYRGPRGKAAVSWIKEMEAAFQAARESLADTALLDHPAADAELVLVTDTSALHVGGVLQQQRRRGQSWRPLGFYSKKLSQAEATENCWLFTSPLFTFSI